MGWAMPKIQYKDLILARIEQDKGELNERQTQFLTYVLEVADEIEKDQIEKRRNKGFHPSHRAYKP